jgi:hypothetical protein
VTALSTASRTDLDRKGGDAEAEEADGQLVLGVDRAGEDLLDALQNAQQPVVVGVVPCDLRSRDLIDVVDLVLRADLSQPLGATEEEHPGVGDVAMAHRAQRHQQVRIAQPEQPGVGAVAPEDVSGPRDLDRIDVVHGKLPGALAAPVQRPGGDLRTDEALGIHRHAVLADTLLEEPLRRPIRRMRSAGNPHHEQPSGPFGHRKLHDLHLQVGPGAVEDPPPPDVEVVAGRSMDRLRPSSRSVGDAEDNHASLGVREAGGILHRDLQVFPGPLPRLEVEPLRFEIVGWGGVQPVEKGEDVLAGRDGHKEGSTIVRYRKSVIRLRNVPA